MNIHTKWEIKIINSQITCELSSGLPLNEFRSGWVLPGMSHKTKQNKTPSFSFYNFSKAFWFYSFKRFLSYAVSTTLKVCLHIKWILRLSKHVSIIFTKLQIVHVERALPFAFSSLIFFFFLWSPKVKEVLQIWKREGSWQLQN